MTQPSGWYDDPQDSTKLRYWDGVIWTQHVTPKQAPTLEQSTIGMPYQQPAAQPGTQAGRPAYPPAPAPMQSWPQAYVTAPPSTPDGVPLSGWWKRVGARLIDGIITFVIALPLTGYFFVGYYHAATDYIDRQIAQAGSGRPPASPFTLPVELYKWLLPIALIGLLVSVVYEFLFLTRTGATLGKKWVGISVRLRETPGPPPANAVWRRLGVIYGLQLLGIIPLLGSLTGIAGLLNYLWPLWDVNRQCWHDKAAKTNVVVGPQPNRTR